MATTTNKFIEQIKFKNYKSIKDATIKLTNLNVLIGANGAGKSNFISFFNFFNYYIRDVVKANCHALELNKPGIYNIGSGETTTWNSLSHALFKALDKPSRIEYVDMPTDLKAQYQNYTCAEIVKTKNALQQNFVTTPFPDAVADYVQNYLLKGALW